MNRELLIKNVVPAIIEHDQIGLTIEAALIEGSDEEGGFAVQNVNFEVWIGAQKVYEGVSDATTGVFAVENIPIGKVDPHFEVVVSAKDEVGKLTIRVAKDVETLMKEIESRNKKAEDREPKLSPAEIATKARETKEAVRKGLDQLLTRKYDEFIEDDYTSGYYFDVDTDKHVKSEKWERYGSHVDWHDRAKDSRKNASKLIKKAFEIVVEHHTHPLVKREIIAIAKNHAYPFLIYSSYYDASWAEAVVIELAKIEPKKILEKVVEFHEYAWAKSIVAQITEQNPGLLFSEIEFYEYEPWAEEICMRAAKLDPASAVKHYDKYRDQPWAEGVFEFAKSEAAILAKIEGDVKRNKRRKQRAKPSVEPDKGISLTPEEAERERKTKESIRNAMDFLLEREHFRQRSPDDDCWVYFDPEVSNEGKWMESENVEFRRTTNSKMQTDAIQFPYSINNSFKELVDHDSHPLVKHEIAGIAQRNPKPFIKYSHLYVNASWAEIVMSELAKMEPEKILEKVKEFYKYPWAKNIVSQIADSNAALALERIDLYEYQPWAEEIAMKAAAIDPESAIKHYDKYRDQPWAEKLLIFARQKREENKAAEARLKAEESEARSVALAKRRKERAAEEAEWVSQNKTSEITKAVDIFSKNRGITAERDAFQTFVKHQGDERVISAVNELVSAHPESFLIYHDVYVGATWGEAVTRKLAKIYPVAAYNLLLERFYGEPFTSERLMAAVNYVVGEDDSKLIPVIVECFEKCLSFPWVKEVLGIAAPRLIGIKDTGLLQRVILIYSEYEQEQWSQAVLADARMKVEEKEWIERARKHRANTAAEILAHHLDKPWAGAVLRLTCKNDQPVCATIFAALDSYAGKPWAKELYMDIVRLHPTLPYSNWPTNSHGWDSEMITVILEFCRLKNDPVGVATHVVKNCVDKPYAEAVLREMCKPFGKGCEVVYAYVDNYAAKPWGKSLYLEAVAKFPSLPVSIWPRNTHGWDDEIIDIVSKAYIVAFEKDGSSSHGLIRMCLDDPASERTKKFVARIRITNPEFAERLVRPNPVLKFLKDIFS